MLVSLFRFSPHSFPRLTYTGVTCKVKKERLNTKLIPRIGVLRLTVHTTKIPGYKINWTLPYIVTRGCRFLWFSRPAMNGLREIDLVSVYKKVTATKTTDSEEKKPSKGVRGEDKRFFPLWKMILTWYIWLGEVHIGKQFELQKAEVNLRGNCTRSSLAYLWKMIDW